MFKYPIAMILSLHVQILKQIPLENKHILKKPEPVARFESFGDSGLNLCLYSWLKDTNQKLDIKRLDKPTNLKRFKEEKYLYSLPTRSNY